MTSSCRLMCFHAELQLPHPLNSEGGIAEMVRTDANTEPLLHLSCYCYWYRSDLYGSHDY